MDSNHYCACDYSHTCSSLTSLVSGSLIKGGSGAGIIVWVVRTIEGTAGIIEGAVGVIEGDEVKGMYRGDIFENNILCVISQTLHIPTCPRRG